MAGTTALISAWPDDDPNGEDAGAVYVFEGSGDSWQQATKLAPEDGDRQDEFGTGVALGTDGSTALIGARVDEDPNGGRGFASGGGSAYLFRRVGNGWTRAAKLAATDRDGADQFGGAVALGGNTALIGADADEDPNGELSGSAYVFRI